MSPKTPTLPDTGSHAHTPPAPYVFSIRCRRAAAMVDAANAASRYDCYLAWLDTSTPSVVAQCLICQRMQPGGRQLGGSCSHVGLCCLRCFLLICNACFLPACVC